MRDYKYISADTHLEVSPEKWRPFVDMLFGIQDDYYAVQNRHEIGVENTMWATDFPHVATNWRDSMKLISELFKGVPENEKRLIGL